MEFEGFKSELESFLNKFSGKEAKQVLRNTFDKLMRSYQFCDEQEHSFNFASDILICDACVVLYKNHALKSHAVKQMYPLLDYWVNHQVNHYEEYIDTLFFKLSDASNIFQGQSALTEIERYMKKIKKQYQHTNTYKIIYDNYKKYFVDKFC